MIGNGIYHGILESGILAGYAVRNGIPMWEYIANRFLTLIENVMLGQKLSEYHTGYRAFSREKMPLDINFDDFVFDNQILAQIA